MLAESEPAAQAPSHVTGLLQSLVVLCKGTSLMSKHHYSKLQPLAELPWPSPCSTRPELMLGAPASSALQPAASRLLLSPCLLRGCCCTVGVDW